VCPEVAVVIRNQAAPERELDREEGRAEVIRLRRAGVSYDDIQAATGINRATAHRWVKLALARAAEERSAEAEMLRVESIERLEALLAAVWPRAMDGSERHVDQARKIVSDIGDLTGVKAPIAVTIGEIDIDRAIAEARRLLDERSRALDGEVVHAEIAAGPSGEPDD
jgi:hypothetical protein